MMRRLIAGLAISLQASAALAVPAVDSRAVVAQVLAGQTINAAFYGLTCDGSTDNSSALNLIHTASAAKTGQTVYFPPQSNTCITSAAINGTPNTIYFAYPGTVTLKVKASSSASPLLFSAASTHDILVYGLTFDGNVASVGNANNVTLNYYGKNIVFDHVTWQNTRGIALLFSGDIVTSGVRDSVFNNIGNYWQTSGSASDRAQAFDSCCATATANSYGNFSIGNKFLNVGLDSVSTGGQTNFQFENNYCFNSVQQWLTLSSLAYNACIYASGIDGLTAIGNIANGMSGNAFDLPGGKRLVISGNLLANSGQAGIGLFAVTNFTVTGNQLYNNGQWSSSVWFGGITFDDVNTNGVVSGNIATDYQSTKTQPYGLDASTYTGQGHSAVQLVNVDIDPNNRFQGNLTGDVHNANYGLQAVTVASLEACSATTKLNRAWVTDALSPTFLATVVGGGSSVPFTPVFCNGTNWVVGSGL